MTWAPEPFEYNGHLLRYSMSAQYDHVCKRCGVADYNGNEHEEPCKGEQND